MRRRWRRAGISALACAALAAMPARAQSSEEIFVQANRAYDEGRFDAAAEALESLVARGVRDSRLEFNLGNVEFRRGRLGQAILHFERARRLDPSDPEIKDNLEFARARRVDQVPEPAVPAGVAGVLGALDRLGAVRLAWIALGVFWLAAAVVAWALAEPGRWNAIHGWIVAGLLVVLLGVSAAGYAAHRRRVGESVAVVLAERVAVLAGPGVNNAQLATIHEGLDVAVRGLREGWVQVRLPNGVGGWIARDAVEFVQ